MVEAIAKITETEGVATEAAQPYIKDEIGVVYLITSTGLDILIGKDGDEIKRKIEQDTKYSLFDYRRFDDDDRVWAYWAVQDGEKVKPLTLPNPTEYSLTSPQLYTKAVTYPHILAHAVGLLKEKPISMWDKMMKPTTIILAIVAIVFVMGLMLMALQG